MPWKPPAHQNPVASTWDQRQAAYERARPSSTARGYDLAWRRLRMQFLAENPICCQCDAPATDVDHILSLRSRPDLRLAWSNLRSLCHAHHSARTSRDQGWGRG